MQTGLVQTGGIHSGYSGRGSRQPDPISQISQISPISQNSRNGADEPPGAVRLSAAQLISALQPRRSGDGSFSLWCPRTGEAFHSADGALAEARRVFITPAGLERHRAGSRLRVLEVAVGTGTNTAALLEAADDHGLQLDWWGLELDPAPLRLALDDAGFRSQWRPGTISRLEQLCSSDRLLWGDARRSLARLLDGDPSRSESVIVRSDRCDLVLLDAFSPQRCPALWSLEFLNGLAQLLAPQGRLLTYCSAAAVRSALEQAGLQLASIRSAPGSPSGLWSAGTAAAPALLSDAAWLRPLSVMEREHMASRAGEPYRDPDGTASREAILAERRQRQQCSPAEPAAAWQRRWGLTHRHHSRRLASAQSAVRDADSGLMPGISP